MIEYPEPEKYVSTSTYPNIPIDPVALSTKVMQELKMFGNVIPTKTPQMVEELCRTFNKVIEVNKSRNKVQVSHVFPGRKSAKPLTTNNETPKTFIVSPKTGSAKSLSALMYVALLQEESSIIVVSTVDDATKACEYINAERTLDNYARCYYTISAKNKKHPYRVEKSKLYQCKCIVVTHAMFKQANYFDDINKFSKFRAKKRDLVIIDERIDLYSRYSISTEQVLTLEHVVIKLIKEDKLNLSSELKQLQAISTLFAELKKTANTDKTDIILEVKTPQSKLLSNNTFPSITSKSSKKTLTADTVLHQLNFNKLEDVINNMKYDIPAITSSVNSKASRKSSKGNRKTLIEYLNALTYISYNECSFYLQGRYNTLMTTNNILNQFGSSVILDATACVNEIYKVSRWYQPDFIELVETTNPRKYHNFTINKAIGFNQSKDVVFRKLNDVEFDQAITDYMLTILSIMSPSDKLLIVAHQEFREYLEKELAKWGIKNVEFTHWGNHRGKNKWSDCNKVMIIGWHYFPPIEHYGNYINAVGNLEYTKNATPAYEIKVIKTKFQITQLADDLVQAISRCSVRKTSSKDGDCAVSEAYILYPDNKEGKEVVGLVEAQFNGAVIKQWNPQSLSAYKKILKSKANAEKVKNYILNALTWNNSITQVKVTQRFLLGANKMSKSAIGRVFTNKTFEDMLDDVGIEKYALNKTSKAFRFIV